MDFASGGFSVGRDSWWMACRTLAVTNLVDRRDHVGWRDVKTMGLMVENRGR